MDKRTWSNVDDFLGTLRARDDVLQNIRVRSDAANLPNISVSDEHGWFLSVLAGGVNARSILEIGTLGGISAVHLARALRGEGHLVTLEADANHAKIARENFANAGVSGLITIVEGPALETLPQVLSDHPDGFDFIFIDADKEAYPDYWKWAMRLAHPGSVIVADNVIRDGGVADEANDDQRVVGVREYLRLAMAEPGVTTSAIQTVGVKGYDGFAISLVEGSSAK